MPNLLGDSQMSRTRVSATFEQECALALGLHFESVHRGSDSKLMWHGSLYLEWNRLRPVPLTYMPIMRFQLV